MMKYAAFATWFPLTLGGCASSAGLDSFRHISVTYQSQEKQAGKEGFPSRMVLTNQGATALENKGWALYFNFGRLVIPESLPESVHITPVNGDLVRLEPTERFAPLRPGESRQIPFRTRRGVFKECDAPAGLYFALTKGSQAGQAAAVSDYRIQPIPSSGDSFPAPQRRFRENASLSLLPADQVAKIVPTAALYRPGNGSLFINENMEIASSQSLSAEADFLAAALEPILGSAPQLVAEDSGPAPNRIILRLANLRLGSQAATKEAYRLRIDGQGIEIAGSDAAGIFYGIQTLRALLPLRSRLANVVQQPIELEYARLEDWPMFGYRGMHLDVSRNFHSKQSVLKLLDLMAFYKLNRFHFHLSDDEGWRLPVEALPELTQVGGRRGHSLDERDYLVPSFGSGPDPDASQGSGAYSRDDFIEILRYARQRHIEVIPEIDVPGHARAAIKSMQSRYHRLMAEGRPEEALEFLLSDPGDESRYRSIQGWKDNVVNPCQESTYRFLETVVDELVALYREAGAPLTTIHTGGDEVPRGVWAGSPACQRLLAESQQLSSVEELADYFLKRFHELIDSRGLITAGWEEIAFQESSLGHGHGDRKPHPDFLEERFLAYVWNTSSGSGSQDGAYRLANAGYRVVLSNASNLYFDLAYDADPKEPGYTWAGLVDTRKPYEFAPFDLTRGGSNLEALTAEGKKNIAGIQGQLWSENAKGPELMEYLAFPKLLGLAERAWAQQPDWMSMDGSQREQALATAWNRFANGLGQRELPRLDYLFGGVGYRLPPPGAVIEEGILKANLAFPGLEIRYTTDGTVPEADSTLYQGPVAVEGPVQLRSFDTRGRGSRVSAVSQE
ncbi:MAG: family 20 glycosylhydrolase [Acidobacteriota bacterium]